MLLSMNFANLFIILTLVFSALSHAQERINTAKMDDVQKYVNKLVSDVGAENILVVYDFDNTLMAMDLDLGSDQWYQWQSEAIKSGKKKEQMAKNTGELFNLAYKLFALGDMHAVESDTPRIVSEIQKSKIKSIILTSRGSEYRQDVLAELERAGMNFADSAIGPKEGYAGLFVPEGFERPRLISFSEGIVMGSGQNKGEILKFILKKTGLKFKKIVFVDDTLKNIENVEKSFADEKNMIAFFYTHEADRVKKFEGNKTRVWREWKHIRPALDFISSEQKSRAAEFSK